MKSLTIAIKDLTRSFRSTFAVIFMFVIPLLVTGLFYLMFGNLAHEDETEMSIPGTKVVIVNLDRGSAYAGNLGQALVDSLQSTELEKIMEITLVADASTARQLVDSHKAGVGLVIPTTFSESFENTDHESQIEFIQDPTLTVGPEIVFSIINQFVDAYAGMKITLQESMKQAVAGQIEYDQVGQLVGTYNEKSQSTYDSRALIETDNPTAQPGSNPLLSMIGPIMGGMMIFYAFFTGVNAANSILHEDEEGTLKRLFSTPTSQREVLTGKFLSVGLTVIVQVVVLMMAARLLFGIQWGDISVVAINTLGIVCSASTFGILVCSLMKNTKQGGIIFGGLLTVTGMLGMINIFTGNFTSTRFGIVSLLVPQGWAARVMLIGMNGGTVYQVLPTFLVLLAMSIVFFIAGVWRFQKRYA